MPPEQRDVSVIVPAYRAAATIERALRSIAAQTVPPREVIVVDDGSDDGTFEAASSCRAVFKDIDFKLFQQENRGAGAARNRAVTEASGDILAFLDADDEWLPEHLEKSLGVMESGGYLVVGHNVLIFEDGKERLNDCAARFREAGDTFVTLYRKGYLATCTLLTRREAVIAAGGFDESLRNAQDFELWLALLRAPGASFAVFEAPLARYHVTKGSIMSHTRRRLDCCLIVAARYAPDLKHRPGSMLASLLFRVAAVHYEAAAAYLANRRYLPVIAVVAAAPIRALVVTAQALTGRVSTRPRTLAVGRVAPREPSAP